VPIWSVAAVRAAGIEFTVYGGVGANVAVDAGSGAVVHAHPDAWGVV
jgi:hypothetical protein